MNREALKQRADTVRSSRPAHTSQFERFVIEALLFIINSLEEFMGDVVPGLQADVDELAAVIPEIASNLVAEQQRLEAAEAEKKAAIEQSEADSAEAERLKGELAAIEASKTQLDGIVEQAKALVPAAPEGGQPTG